MTEQLATIDLLGYWLGIFLTFCILSFLYKDNPFYKFAEHLFVGTSIGYLVILQYYDVLRPKVVEPIADADRWYWNLALIPLVLVALMFVKLISRRLSWTGRYPIAFVVALYAGIQINGVTQADLGEQMTRAMDDPVARKIDVNTAEAKEMVSLPGFTPAVADAVVARRAREPLTSLDQLEELPALNADERAEIHEARGSLVGLDARASTGEDDTNWFGVLSNLLLVAGLLAGLVYFYFSAEQKGAVGKVARFGVWVLMIGFGASFGLTVMGRLALAIGRIQYLQGDAVPREMQGQVQGPLVSLVSIAIIVGGIAAWEMWLRRRKTRLG
ncbi:MAG TPA: helix-hairpin-helix domain-containing protein [Kofleriaceae bacterium]|nr:helix-hairpin-helix domain-containing protein [Kofleriaceae bacterium]